MIITWSAIGEIYECKFSGSFVYSERVDLDIFLHCKTKKNAKMYIRFYRNQLGFVEDTIIIISVFLRLTVCVSVNRSHSSLYWHELSPKPVLILVLHVVGYSQLNQCAFALVMYRTSLQTTELMMWFCWTADHKLWLDALCTVHLTSSRCLVKRSLTHALPVNFVALSVANTINSIKKWKEKQD